MAAPEYDPQFYFIQFFKKICETKKLHIFVKPKGCITIFMRRDVFQAIADPTRREILHMVAYEPLNVNAVAGQFDVSRAAIYKHMKILAECGLIVMKQQGRERYCEAKLEKLNEVSDWVEQYKQFWAKRLDSLEQYINELQSKNNEHDNDNQSSKH
jgi:DNA-binding transcriptional ArsR family regulator